MVCSRWGFQKLVVLKLWKLERLEHLVVEEKAMQNIRELETRSCNKLKVTLMHLRRREPDNLLSCNAVAVGFALALDY
ncbi:putative disease resistance RPP8-like protein 2 [Prunus yedoensis var. nudiflora]|uniref:Putative disease resistance RPP8-like protein 2 n=1 Tax=Prunus yedoensis var. nudiflora TaxID=2094558 RepID=A0A314ULG8_PRUYE|nr:putative disease resistance RPP8-like protein 2 [Prunus yedoensis var. nudiflora]